MAQHLEGGAARADHDRGLQLGARHRARRQDLPDLVPAAQVGRELATGGVAQAAEVDELGEAGVGCGIAHVGGGLAVAGGPVAVAPDRVDEVVGGPGAGERLGEGLRVEGIAAHHLDRPAGRPVRAAPVRGLELGGGAGDGADTVARLDQLGDEAPADVAGGTEHQDGVLVGGRGHRPFLPRTCLKARAEAAIA